MFYNQPDSDDWRDVFRGSGDFKVDQVIRRCLSLYQHLVYVCQPPPVVQYSVMYWTHDVLIAFCASLSLLTQHTKRRCPRRFLMQNPSVRHAYVVRNSSS